MLPSSTGVGPMLETSDAMVDNLLVSEVDVYL